MPRRQAARELLPERTAGRPATRPGTADEGVPAPLLASAGLAALVGVGLLRHRLHRRRRES